MDRKRSMVKGLVDIHVRNFDTSGTLLVMAEGRFVAPKTVEVALNAGGTRYLRGKDVVIGTGTRARLDSIWAVGNVTGGPQFTHISFDDFRIVRDNITGGARTTTGRLIPFAMFTDTEPAHVGLREHEAKAKGIDYRIFKIPMIAVLRTRMLSETRGFMKALVEQNDDGRSKLIS